MKLHDIIKKAVWLKGQRVDEGTAKDIAVMAKYLEKDLSLPKYSNLSEDEVDYAIEQGVKGKWGEYHGINIISLLRFIDDYMRSDERVKKLRAKALPEKTEPSIQERVKILKQGVLTKFDNFCQDGNCHDFGNVSYNFLDKNGLINYTPDKKQEFMFRAEENIRAENFKKVTSVRAAMQSLVKSFETDDVKAEAKRLALKEYFQNIVDMGGEEDFINEIKKL